MTTMNKLKIYVACHKPFDVIKNEVYTPIHVGRTVSKFKEEMAEMIGDNTGDNISEKNPYYSEMTAQYWAWKNVKDIEYVGFVHYRRNFAVQFTNENVDTYFEDGTDVIVAGPVLRDHNRYNFLKDYVCNEDFAIMMWVIKRLYPEYERTLSDYANGIIDYPLNMLICRKDLFNKYAEWVFDILFECEKYIQRSPYSRARRVYGYLSEFLMPVFFLHNHYKIKPLKYISTDGSIMGGIKKSTMLKMKLIDWIYWRGKQKPLLYIDDSIRIGLRNDNVIDFDNLNA